MTPVERVLSKYGLPFELYPYQVETINELAPLPRSGHYLAVGVGKTATSTVSALYKKDTGQADKVIVLMPPILLKGWYRWLDKIIGIGEALIYRGTPAERKRLRLGAHDFTLMTYQIFKKDYERILKSFNPAKTVLICDEATAIKNVGSQNYKAVRDFVFPEGHLMLLTGTPLAKIEDGYAYVKLVAPNLYRNLNHFNNLHVLERDFFNNPKVYGNLEILERNMKVNAKRILKEDVLHDLPKITYTPLHYDLDPKHLALYKKLAEEQLLEFDDGSKIDATETTKLWHSLQQICVNWGHFSGDPDDKAAGLDLVDEILEELGDGKLIIFTGYRMSSRLIWEYTKKDGSVAVYGDVSRTQQERNIDLFMNDPKCRVLVAHVVSSGYGLNLQECCSDILFLEMPLVPIHFEQAVGRVYRNGQKNPVHIRTAVAAGTIQNHIQRLLMEKDHLVNKVVRNFKDIRAAIYGD